LRRLRQWRRESEKRGSVRIADLLNWEKEVVDGMENIRVSGNVSQPPFKREDVRFTFLTPKPEVAPAVLSEIIGE
jgi:hypothetical protein